jgi:hypothetical protein
VIRVLIIQVTTALKRMSVAYLKQIPLEGEKP